MKILIQINIILDHFASTLEFVSVDEISDLLYLQLLRLIFILVKLLKTK